MNTPSGWDGKTESRGMGNEQSAVVILHPKA